MPEAKKKAAKKTGSGARTAPAARRPKAAAAKTTAPKTGTTGVAAAPATPRRTAGRPAPGGSLVIEQTGSGIGCLEAHKRTLRALGLRHPRQRVARPDNPAIRGMVAAIPHLVRIVEG